MTIPEVYAKSHVRLIYLGPGKYAEIRPNHETATPLVSPDQLTRPPSPKPKKGRGRGRGSKRAKPKSTCRTTGSKRPKISRNQVHLDSSLQAARDRKYGLHTSRPVRETRRSIDYAKLNDGA